MFLSPLEIGTSSSRPTRRTVGIATDANRSPVDTESLETQGGSTDTGNEMFSPPTWGGSSATVTTTLTTGATVGIIIGTLVAFAVLGAVIWALIRWRRKRRRFFERRRGTLADVYPSFGQEGAYGKGGPMQGGKEGVEFAMGGMGDWRRRESDGSETTKVDDDADSIYTHGVAVLEPSPLPMPGTPETTPSTPKTLPRHAVQRGIFDTPDQADHSHPDVAVPSAENSHTTPPVQTSSQFLRFNPSPTSTAVLSRLAKIHDHPVSPSSTGHSWDPSPIDGPVEGHTAGRWPLGNKAVNGEAAAATAPKTG